MVKSANIKALFSLFITYIDVIHLFTVKCIRRATTKNEEVQYLKVFKNQNNKTRRLGQDKVKRDEAISANYLLTERNLKVDVCYLRKIRRKICFKKQLETNITNCL